MGNVFASLKQNHITPMPLIPLLICERIVYYSKDINLRLVDHNFNQLVLSKSEYNDDDTSLLLSLLKIATIKNNTVYTTELISFDVVKHFVYLKLYSNGWVLELFNKIIQLPDIIFANETRFHFHFRPTNNKIVPLMITKGRIYNLKLKMFLNQGYEDSIKTVCSGVLLGHTIYSSVAFENKFIIFSYNDQREPIYQSEIFVNDLQKLHMNTNFEINYHVGQRDNFLDHNILVMGNKESIMIFSLLQKQLHQVYLDCWFIDFFDVIGTTNNHVVFVVKNRDNYFSSIDRRRWKIHYYDVITKSNKIFEVTGRKFKNYGITSTSISYTDENKSIISIEFNNFERDWRMNEPTLVKSLL